MIEPGIAGSADGGVVSIFIPFIVTQIRTTASLVSTKDTVSSLASWEFSNS